MAPTKPIPSHRYYYRGYNTQGQYISGELDSPSLQLAKIQLKRQGIRLERIQKKSLWLQFKHCATRSITAAEICLFTRQLTTLLNANIPLLKALTLIQSGLQHPGMHNLVHRLSTQIESGQALSQALAQHTPHFDSLYIALIRTGELSGTLEIMLERIANDLEKALKLKQKIKKALWYPILVLIVACGVSLILILKVVPIFHELFTSFAVELPLFTQWVLLLSQWLQDSYLFLVCSCVITTILIYYSYRHCPQAQYQIDRYCLSFPIFGSLCKKSLLARFHRTLATTFAAGVPLLTALKYAAALSHNSIYQKAVIKIHDDIASGQQLHLAMQNTQLFPHIAIQMIAIGEESGALTEMFNHVAERFETDVTLTAEGLSNLLEPCLLIFLSLIVGSLVIAMYLPIFKMGSII